MLGYINKTPRQKFRDFAGPVVYAAFIIIFTVEAAFTAILLLGALKVIIKKSFFS